MKKIILGLLVLSAIIAGFAQKKKTASTSTAKAPVSEKKAEPKVENKIGTIHLTKKEFLAKVANYETNPTEWIYLGDKPCIIDFYATWCGPCKMISPILEELAKEYNGQIYIYKIDIDQEKDLAQAFQIRGVPTLLFCGMKGNPQAASGALPKEALVRAINEVLLKK